MASPVLLGVALAPLFAALAQVESDNGKTSTNIYQITKRYVDDVNRISENEKFTYGDVNDKERSERMMEIYLTNYCVKYMDDTGRLPTWETMARIHNGGPRGWSKYATKKYWRKVKAELEKEDVV